MINGIRDHVFPELLLPDFALFWSHALKRNRGGGVAFNGEAFARHYDSKITYGETVAGLSVWRASLLVMAVVPPATRWNASASASSATRASRRSASRCPYREEASTSCRGHSERGGDAAAVDDDHSIVWPSRPEAAPAWNTSGERRSVTLRATKPWSGYRLANRVTRGPAARATSPRASAAAVAPD